MTPKEPYGRGSVAPCVLLCTILPARDLGRPRRIRRRHHYANSRRLPRNGAGRRRPQFFVFYSGKASWRVPYEKINLVEYGEKVDRRYIAAVLISPLFLLAKKRQHFLTVGYSDEDDRQQAMIFKINKDDIRATLVALEARTGPQGRIPGRRRSQER